MPTERKLNLPFQKPLTVVIMQDNGPNQAKEDLAKIADEQTSNVVRIGVSENYFHQLRLEASRNPELRQKIAVFYLDENQTLHDIGLGFKDEIRWPVGFMNEAWNIEEEIIKARSESGEYHAD